MWEFLPDRWLSFWIDYLIMYYPWQILKSKFSHEEQFVDFWPLFCHWNYWYHLSLKRPQDFFLCTKPGKLQHAFAKKYFNLVSTLIGYLWTDSLVNFLTVILNLIEVQTKVTHYYSRTRCFLYHWLVLGLPLMHWNTLGIELCNNNSTIFLPWKLI